MILRAKLGTMPATLYYRSLEAPKVGTIIRVYALAPEATRFKYQRSFCVHVDRYAADIGMWFLSN